MAPALAFTAVGVPLYTDPSVNSIEDSISDAITPRLSSTRMYCTARSATVACQTGHGKCNHAYRTSWCLSRRGPAPNSRVYRESLACITPANVWSPSPAFLAP